MKIIFSSTDNPTKTCELCLEPMKFLSEQADFRLFKCNDCALVSTDRAVDVAAPFQAPSPRRPSFWR
ncbi:hypothetical protein SAMN05216525_1327 [Bradyrhizobium sp. Gha]|nr:hypothetical protein SAMN05216525_1327 [Bradyrhizobium sp. Gha]